MPDLEMKISGDMVRGIIDAKIKAAIVSELGKEKELIGYAVDRLLEMKVAANGKQSTYSSENKYNLIEGLTRAAFAEAVGAAVRGWVAERQPEIREAVARELARKSKGMAKILVDGVGNALKDSWRLSVRCEFTEGDR